MRGFDDLLARLLGVGPSGAMSLSAGEVSYATEGVTSAADGTNAGAATTTAAPLAGTTTMDPSRPAAASAVTTRYLIALPPSRLDGTPAGDVMT
jgi:hypothetical protein